MKSYLLYQNGKLIVKEKQENNKKIPKSIPNLKKIPKPILQEPLQNHQNHQNHQNIQKY